METQEKSSTSKRVNYIQHLLFFYSCIRRDDRLKANDISLYLALFQIWNANDFRSTFYVFREEALTLSKIGSRSTYVACLKWLHQCGYIKYLPSDRPYVPSQISIIIDPCVPAKMKPHEQVNNESPVRYENIPGTGLNPGHNYSKQINNKTESQKTLPQKKIISHEEKTPTFEAAEDWFSQRGHPAQEARKFFYHYQAVDWTLGGQPIADWQAAAAKWAENIKTDSRHKPGKLHTDDKKSYTHPL